MAEEQISSKFNSLSLTAETTPPPPSPPSPPPSSSTITLITADGIKFEIESSIAKQMETVQSYIGDSDGNSTTMPLPNVYSQELPLILDYCENDIAGKINKSFEAEFVKNLNNEEVKELFLAANYLNITKLFEFLSQVIADRIANKSVEYVRKYFGIENDYTPKEEAKIREELAWTFKGVDEDDDD